MRAGDVVADRFEVDLLAGSGGMGEVYRAHDRQTGARVAIKVLKASAADRSGTRQRFEREALALATLSQDGVVRHLAHGATPEGDLFLAMEWLEGETLAELLARRTLSIAETVTLGKAAAHALAAVHARGFVHRDVKPSNLFLRDGDVGRVVLIDFGVVREPGGPDTLTRTGSVLGTVGYMAPEQARGMRNVGPRADVFSFGCVLYRCLAGQPPFGGDDMVSVLLKVVAEEPPALRELAPELPPDLEEVIGQMLSKLPEGRPANAGEVAAALDAIDVTGDTSRRKVLSKRPGNREITSIERRIACLVLVRGAGGASEAEPTTDVRWDGDPQPQSLGQIAQRYRGQVDVLADRSVLVTFTSAGAATDLAVRAARCALAFRELRPDASVVLVSGRSVLAGRLPVGELIERAVALVPEVREVPVRIDDATAALLGARFEVKARGEVHELLAERDAFGVGRTLLGRPVPCVGRESELGALESAFARAVDESAAGVVLVTGPPGIGKSRLRDELLRRVRARGEAIYVWTGQADPMSAGSPFGLLGKALRGMIGIQESDAPAQRRGVLLGRVTGVVKSDAERIAAFVGEVCGVPFPDDAHPMLRTARRDPQRMFDLTRRAFTDLVRAMCERRPLLVVLEDLQWGDLPTVKLVDAVLSALPDAPLFVLALARPEVTNLFPNLWAERSVSHVRLAPLSRKASERLVKHALGDAVSDDTLRKVVDRAGGHAFYLEELVRVVAAGADDTLPETVLAMVQARLEALDPEVRRVLRAASVLGQTFWLSAVHALAGKGPIQAYLAELCDQELISQRHEPRFAGEVEYAFRHALVREAAYAMLTEADRALGHALAAEWLEAAGETDAMLMAEHEERGDNGARASVWYQRAAEQALDGGDYEAALARAERAIELLARGPSEGATDQRTGELRLFQAGVHRLRGANAEQLRAGDLALASLAAGSPTWCAAASETATAAGKLAQRERVLELSNALLAAGAGPADDRDGAARRAIAIARVVPQLFYMDRLPLAEALLALAESVASRAGDDLAALAEITRAKGTRALVRGDTGLYLDIVRQGCGLYERMGDLRSAYNYRCALGFAVAQVGDYEESERILRETVAAAERLRLSVTRAYALENLGMTLAHLGKLDEAQRLEDEVVRDFERQGDRRMVAGARIYLAMVQRLAGDFPGARATAQLVLDDPTAPVPFRALTYGVLARAWLGEGRKLNALAAAESGMSVLAQVGSIEEGEAGVRLAFAESLHACGRVAEARAAIATAKERVLARAAKIASEPLRESFLRRVHDHARILELAELWARAE